MISSVKDFKRKMKHLPSKVQARTWETFKISRQRLRLNRSHVRYTQQIDSCLSEFDRRFLDFDSLETVATFISNP